MHKNGSALLSEMNSGESNDPFVDRPDEKLMVCPMRWRGKAKERPGNRPAIARGGTQRSGLSIF